MHTFEFNGMDGQVVIHHNSDFSGDAIIHRKNPIGKDEVLHVPCAALLAFAAEYVRGRRISALEQAGYREILNGHTL